MYNMITSTHIRYILVVTFVCITVAFLQIPLSAAWKQDRRPIFMGDRIPLKALMPHSKRTQKKIVLYHNFFRTKVTPRASNMLKMKWHKQVAVSAHRWAKSCMFLTHDNVTGRHVNNYGACGQNIFVSSHQVPW